MGAYMARHALVPDRVICRRHGDARNLGARLAAGVLDRRRRKRFERARSTTPAPIPSSAVIKETARGRAQPAGGRPQSRPARTRAAADRLGRRRGARAAERGLPTAALAVIDFAVDDWRKLHPRGGRLERFVSPRSLAPPTRFDAIARLTRPRPWRRLAILSHLSSVLRTWHDGRKPTERDGAMYKHILVPVDLSRSRTRQARHRHRGR